MPSWLTLATSNEELLQPQFIQALLLVIIIIVIVVVGRECNHIWSTGKAINMQTWMVLDNRGTVVAYCSYPCEFWCRHFGWVSCLALFSIFSGVRWLAVAGMMLASNHASLGPRKMGTCKERAWRDYCVSTWCTLWASALYSCEGMANIYLEVQRCSNEALLMFKRFTKPSSSRFIADSSHLRSHR